jgi:hypothetical protein
MIAAGTESEDQRKKYLFESALFRTSIVTQKNLNNRSETMPRKTSPPPVRNPVAKHAARLQRAATFRDRSKYRRHDKHKGREPFALTTVVSR